MGRGESGQAALGAELAKLPKVDRVLAHASLLPYRRRLGAEALLRTARVVLADVRARIRQGEACPPADEIAAAVEAAARRSLSARARPVVNATGVVLHTNLGRAPLAADAVRALAEGAGRYTSVEVDLATGRRGARAAFAEQALADVSGAEAALVVNNNAAAVMLALGALAAGGAAVVSRGELVEIGGGFRVPEVLERSSARLVEVGTTNRTRLSDYERALEALASARTPPEQTVILGVHPGNFRQEGFVEKPNLRELAALARARGVPFVYDLGGGALADLAPLGLAGEPSPRSVVDAGADLVCFSTDKALGGPQGGAIVGRASLVERARRDPLARALRLGRLPLVALEATLALYLEGREGEVPAVAALRAPLEEVRARAERWRSALEARGVEARVVDLEAAVGGGTLPEAPLASAGLELGGDPESLAARLRSGDPPVFARIHAGRLVLDARTVLPGEDGALLDALVAARGG